MDILPFLESHLDFIGRFYIAAAEPFETTMRTIENNEEPFVPTYAPVDEDDFEYGFEWMEADKGLRVIGSCSLGLLQSALHNYLRECVEQVEGPRSEKKRDESWFAYYCRILVATTGFRWDESPVTYDDLEQINLTRNNFAHDTIIGSVSPVQDERHFRKHRCSVFAEPVSLFASLEDGQM